jgi:hypothetical protein
MNTHAEYRRHVNQPPASAPEPATADEASHLARHSDPSLRNTPYASQPTTLTGRRIAWIRPTELHSYAGDVIGRGLDLHAELSRRAARAPRQVARSARRAAPDLTRRGSAASASQEGLQL